MLTESTENLSSAFLISALAKKFDIGIASPKKSCYITFIQKSRSYCMDDVYFPPIDERNLGLIARIYEGNPRFFQHPNCPYSQATKDIFQGTSKFRDFDSHTIGDAVPATDTLLSEINALSVQLKDYGQSVMQNADSSPGDRNTYFRLSITLMEKLVDIREKLSKVKDYELFTSAVLDIMDKELDPDQRQVVLGRLEMLVDTENKGANKDETDTQP
jgi:hypothetical protein